MKTLRTTTTRTTGEKTSQTMRRIHSRIHLPILRFLLFFLFICFMVGIFSSIWFFQSLDEYTTKGRSSTWSDKVGLDTLMKARQRQRRQPVGSLLQKKQGTGTSLHSTFPPPLSQQQLNEQLKRQQEEHSSSSSFSSIPRLLILINSVQRAPDTICQTLESIRKVLLELPSSSTSSSSISPTTILLHRYGSWTCSFPSSSFNSVTDEERFLFYRKDFPPHERRTISNHQQSLDYYTLIQHGWDLVLGGGRTSGNNGAIRASDVTNFTHALFLDDDIELCDHDIFSQTLSYLMGIQNQEQQRYNNHSSYDYRYHPHDSNSSRNEFRNRLFPPTFTLAHLGRGSSGILIPIQHLPYLVYDAILKRDQKHGRKLNVDKAMLEWALYDQRGCVLRPTTIQMRHVGFYSYLHRGGGGSPQQQPEQQTWKDVDHCGGPMNNRDWQGLSDTRFHPSFFSENCLRSDDDEDHDYNSPGIGRCAPYGGRWIPGKSSYCQCLDNYTGDDCGLSKDLVDVYVRRHHTPNPPVVMLLREGNDHLSSSSLITQVVFDAQSHSLINLYVIGNSSHHQQWLTDCIYTSTMEDPYLAFHIELSNSTRYGRLAFPKELILLDHLLSMEELWLLKYYTLNKESR